MSTILEYCFLVPLLVLVVLGAPSSTSSTAKLVRARYMNPPSRIAADDRFFWASVGDSWASGVSFDGNNTDYDGDKNGCHRWKDSYGPLMEANTTWTESAQEFLFAACSGAVLDNIVKNDQGNNEKQMSQVAAAAQMVTYHAGGNNAKFGGTMQTCVYPVPKFGWKGIHYDPEYPTSGPCTESIAASNSYIDNKGEKGLYHEEKATIEDLFRLSSAVNNKDFKLYILSYAHFFNTDDNYCRDLSFAPLASLGGGPPKLSVVLREAINDAVERTNQVLRKVVEDFGDSRVTFIDISPAFNTHRFCETAHTKTNDQWYNKDVWLWNLNLPKNDPPADPKFMDQWLNGGATEFFQANGADGILSGNGEPWTQRPFHPKKGGTEAIMDLIIQQARADRLPGVKQLPTSTPSDGPPGVCTCNESGCSPESPACCASGTC